MSTFIKLIHSNLQFEELEYTIIHLKNEYPNFLTSFMEGVEQLDNEATINALNQLMYSLSLLKMEKEYISLQKCFVLFQINEIKSAFRECRKVIDFLCELNEEIKDFDLNLVYQESKKAIL